MFCPQCGKPLEGSHKFCGHCGAPIPPASKTATAPHTAYTADRNIPPQQADWLSLKAEITAHYIPLLFPLLCYLIVPIVQAFLPYSAYAVVRFVSALLQGAAIASLVYITYTRSVPYGFLWQAPSLLLAFAYAVLYSYLNWRMFGSFVLTLAMWGIALLVQKFGQSALGNGEKAMLTAGSLALVFYWLGQAALSGYFYFNITLPLQFVAMVAGVFLLIKHNV